ncbi:putative lipoprotein [Spiroplasma kunkelii CR2-3x]|uniref:Putative lipoprotein n=1 Tax=Spiroplasma kunkelii CR2-3x TaxID=273035 RepID=A0A0K2JG95_SPIKU|nr:lipoprotein [Spiroplasma kunkelii]ALA97241.1 putative lipoprotein [Spiroplasma kunkelii CR2-3x]
MKKWLSIIGTIGLIATSTTTLISCNKEKNNENEASNQPDPSYNPQQPPENSNWKLINRDNFVKENNEKIINDIF